MKEQTSPGYKRELSLFYLILKVVRNTFRMLILDCFNGISFQSIQHRDKKQENDFISSFLVIKVSESHKRVKGMIDVV